MFNLDRDLEIVFGGPHSTPNATCHEVHCLEFGNFDLNFNYLGNYTLVSIYLL